MIVHLWAAGVIARIPARVDAGGIAYGSGAAKRAIEERALEQFAAKVVQLAKGPVTQPKARKRAQETVQELRAMPVPQDLLDKLNGFSATLERIADERADQAAAMMALLDQVAEMNRMAAAKARRRREEERLITFLMGVA